MSPAKWFLLGWFGLQIFANSTMLIFMIFTFGSLRSALLGHYDVEGYVSLSVLLTNLFFSLPPLLAVATLKIIRRNRKGLPVR